MSAIEIRVQIFHPKGGFAYSDGFIDKELIAISCFPAQVIAGEVFVFAKAAAQKFIDQGGLK